MTDRERSLSLARRGEPEAPPGRASAAAARRRKPRSLWPILALAPALLFFAVFDYFPLGRVVMLSMQATDLFGRPAGFIGLENYQRLLGDPQFLSTLSTTLLFAVGSVTAKLLVGLAIALPLSVAGRGSWLARPVVLIPMAVSVAVAGLVFRALFQPGFGLADQVLAAFGIPSPGWLVNPDFALVSVIIVDTWTAVGFTVLILLAGLASVAEEVREAAAIDGAGAFRTAVHIVIPLITPSLFFLVVYHTIGALREFAVINVLTQGGPANATRTLVIDIWNYAFGANAGSFGAASARAIVLLVIVGAASALQFRISGERVHY